MEHFCGQESSWGFSINKTVEFTATSLISPDEKNENLR